MNFARPRPRRPAEPALPMINVVFLLLIFFLMSAQIVTPPPFGVTPPSAQAPGDAAGEHVLYIGKDGALAFGDARGELVWQVLQNLPGESGAHLLIRADAALPANDLAQALTRASALPFDEILLITAPK